MSLVLLPPGSEDVLLLCRTGLPSSLGGRPFGVALDHLAWETDAGEVLVAMDDPALDGTGFHEAEHDGAWWRRWTSECVRLRPPPGTRGLAIGICGQMPAYLAPDAGAAVCRPKGTANG